MIQNHIGWTGIGNRRAPPAMRLLKRGARLTVCDRNAGAGRNFITAHKVPVAAGYRDHDGVRVFQYMRQQTREPVKDGPA